MKNYKAALIIFFCLLICSSCKKAAKELSEKVTSETVEKGAKNIAKETTEKSLRTLTKKELKNIDWADLLKIIRKENINLGEALTRLDKSFQKKIGKAISSDYEFYTALISSNTIIDEFAVFAKNSPKAAKNIDLFKFFAKSRDLERRFGVNNAVGDILIKEETGIIKLINKNDNTIIGELKDGIFALKQPFKEGSSLLDQNSLLKKTLIPNTTYKIKGKNGLSYLYHVDDYGRFSKIEATGIDTKELLSNVIQAKENVNLGSEFTSKLRKVSQISKGNDIKATLIFKYADDGTTPAVVQADIKAANKKIIGESFENIDMKVIIDDLEIPSGYGGINHEGYTYGQLRRHPIIPEILNGISNPEIKKWAIECNNRNRLGFVMTKINGEYCFKDMRVGPMVKLPDIEDLKSMTGGDLSPEKIRQVSYNLLREEIARQTGLNIKEASSAIGNMLDCVPHEDISGYVFMVPNWAHKWFPHNGYVSSILSQR